MKKPLSVESLMSVISIIDDSDSVIPPVIDKLWDEAKTYNYL